MGVRVVERLPCEVMEAIPEAQVPGYLYIPFNH
jgi:hypothetical protein